MTLKDDQNTTPSALEEEVQQLQANLNQVRNELASLKDKYDTQSSALHEKADEFIQSCRTQGSPVQSLESESCRVQTTQAQSSDPTSCAPSNQAEEPVSTQSEAAPVPPGSPDSVGTVKTPPERPTYSSQAKANDYVPRERKDHIAAGIMAIFLGAFGVHKFYLGYIDVGFIMLAVSVIGSIFTFGLAGFVIWIIALVEGILYLTSSQENFTQKYVVNRCEWF